MTVAADVGFGLGWIVVTVDMEEAKSIASPLCHFASVGPTLSGRIRDAQQKRRHVVSLSRRKLAYFVFVVSGTRVREGHRRSESAINQMPDAAGWVIGIRVRRNAAVNVSAVVAAIGIARNSIPVIRLCVAQSTDRHCRTGHDLITASDDRRLQHPKQLIGMSIGMTTRT